MLYLGCFLIGFCAGWFYAGVLDKGYEWRDEL